jgi:hypothetical protein
VNEYRLGRLCFFEALPIPRRVWTLFCESRVEPRLGSWSRTEEAISDVHGPRHGKRRPFKFQDCIQPRSSFVGVSGGSNEMLATRKRYSLSIGWQTRWISPASDRQVHPQPCSIAFVVVKRTIVIFVFRTFGLSKMQKYGSGNQPLRL